MTTRAMTLKTKELTEAQADECVSILIAMTEKKLGYAPSATKRAVTEEAITLTNALIEEISDKRELKLSFSPSIHFATAQNFGCGLLSAANEDLMCAVEADEDFRVIGLHIYEKQKVEAA